MHVAEDADFDQDVNIDMNLTVDGWSDLDSLHVAEDADFDQDVNIDGNSQTDGNANIDGDLTVDGHTHLDSTLTVEDFADFNDSLDVEMSVNIQDNLDVNDSLAVNSAANSGTVLTVYNSQGAPAVTIETHDSSTSGMGSATTLTTPRLIVQEDATYNGDLTVSGSLGVTGNITSAAAPISPSHMANKQYVDDAIDQAITPPSFYDYKVTNSTSGDTVFYINGDLLLYAEEESGTINYTILLYGERTGLPGDNAIDDMALRARGNTRWLDNADNNLTVFDTNGNGASFNIGYTDIEDLAGGQEDGYVSTTLIYRTVGGATHNTGLTIRFYLDSENSAPTPADFTDPND